MTGTPTQITPIVLRLGETFLKGRNRPFFEKRLLETTARVISPLGGRVEKLHGKLVAQVPPGALEEALIRLGGVFGLSSYSPALQTTPDLDRLQTAAETLVREALEVSETGSPSFKVETRRSDKSFPLTSPEVSRQVGAHLFTRLGLPVDLHQPALRVSVEIGRDRAFVSLRRLPGAGGLPVGSSAPVALLLSGGIDSPVAGYLLARRGCPLHPVTFESPPYTGDEAREKVIDLCGLLARFVGPLTLRVIRFTEAQLAVKRSCPERLAVVLYRRLMVRAAAAVARQEGARALGTGESIGQVASQTLENIHCIQAATDLPILRPLLTYDKVDTVALAERIGTFPISIRPHVDCCSLFVPKHPETRARLEQVLAAEQALGDLDRLVRVMVETAQRVAIPDPFSRP